MLFHFSHNYGEVDSKGFQSCKGCGKARFVGSPVHEHMWEVYNDTQQKCFICGEIKLIPIAPCVHVWKQVEAGKIESGYAGDGPRLETGSFWIFMCEKCKAVKEKRTSLRKDPLNEE
jgi:hypothetical protein